MKKIFIALMSLFVIASVTCTGYIKEWIFPEKPVAKNINLQIMESNNYKHKAYRNSSAMLNVTVITLHGHNTDTLITKDYPDFKLRNLSSYSKEFKQNIYIPNVLDKKEQIIVLYTIKYTSKGSVLTIPNVKYIGRGVTRENILIQI